LRTSTNVFARGFTIAAIGGAALANLSGGTILSAQPQATIVSNFAEVNGLRLHYLAAGTGDPVILLHGYAENSHMWRPLMTELAKTHTVIAPDLRGFGQSSKPEAGYDKKTMAQDVHALATTLGYRRARIVGHDIGLMVAYAYALVLTGEKASGEFLIQQGRLVATNVEGVVVKGSGHWLMEEAPAQVIPKLVSFLNQKPQDTAAMTVAPAESARDARRLTPADMGSLTRVGAGTGTSGVAGIETTVLAGNPASGGPYTIRLRVPADTTIEAHDHRDDRSATVVSGTWYFGYGTRFDERALKALAAGSFYIETPNEPHFAQTRGEPVIVHVSGFGPSSTTYVGKTAVR